MRSLFGTRDHRLVGRGGGEGSDACQMARTASGMTCSKEGKVLKAEYVVLGPGDREIIMDYLADRDDVFEGDDENEDELREEDIVEPPLGASD